MTDDQVRDEVLTLFLAGHETTAVALTWTFWLLAGVPEVEGRWGTRSTTPARASSRPGRVAPPAPAGLGDRAAHARRPRGRRRAPARRRRPRRLPMAPAPRRAVVAGPGPLRPEPVGTRGRGRSTTARLPPSGRPADVHRRRVRDARGADRAGDRGPPLAAGARARSGHPTEAGRHAPSERAGPDAAPAAPSSLR